MTGGIPTFWSLLDEPARQLVREHGRAVEAPAGERMLTQHEEADAVIVLLAGAVRITAQSPGGKEMLLGLRGPGELLGELAALDGQPRAGSAEAFADVRALALSGTVFRRLVQERPGISRAVLVTLATRLRDADAKRLEHVGGDGTARVASRLLELADRLGEDRDGAVVVPLPVTQAELAGWAGTSLETTVRALSALRRAGWLTTGRGTISILDRAAVARRAGRPEA